MRDGDLNIRDEAFVIRSGRPRVRTTYQLRAALHGGSPEQVVAAARSVVLDWIEEKLGRALPKAILDGESDSEELHGQRIEAVCLEAGREWCLRYSRPDEPLPDRAAEPGRTWSTDVALVVREGHVDLGVRDRCASTQSENSSPPRFRPRFVRDLVDRMDVRDVARLTAHPWVVESDAQLDALHGLVQDARRRLPVVLLTEADARRVPLETRRFLLDESWMASNCRAIAHVVVMPRPQSFGWSARVGRTWSAFQGAVRIYRPGLDFAEDALHDHPLVMPERILVFAEDGRTMEDAFQRYLRDQLVAQLTANEPDWTDFRFVREAKAIHAESLRRELEKRLASEEQTALRRRALAGVEADVAEDLKAAESARAAVHQNAIDQLKRHVHEADELAQAYHDDAKQAVQERDRVLEDNRRLRARIDLLLAGLHRGAGTEMPRVERPHALDEIAEWAAKHLAGSLVLHARAVRGLKDAAFENVGLIVDALELLATVYRDVCMGDTQARERLESGLHELGLQSTPSGDETSLGRQGDAYFIRWPFANSPQKLLKMHLKNNGNSRDPRRCLRIYFFWDPDSLQVVVGWLPSHLPNTYT